MIHYGLFNDKVPNNEKNIYHYVYNITTKVTDKYEVIHPFGYVFSGNDKYFTGYGYRCEYSNKKCTDFQNKIDADQYISHTLGWGRAWNVSGIREINNMSYIQTDVSINSGAAAWAKAPAANRPAIRVARTLFMIS